MTADPYIPQYAEPAGEGTAQLPAVEPAPADPAKAPFWTLNRRRAVYWLTMAALIVAGIQQGFITTEATGAWLDALASAGPGLAALAGGIGSLILALRNPTPDN